MRLYRKVVQYLLSQHEKYFVFLGWALFILIGLLQIYKIKGGFITNYGADIIAPVMLYYTTRTKKTFLSELKKEGLNEKQTFTLLWFLCAGWEILQYFNPKIPILNITRGTLDFRDLVTYTGTLIVCYYSDITRIGKTAKSG